MDGSIQLTAKDRKMLLAAYRRGHSAEVSRRAHVILLLADGFTCRQIGKLLFASNDLIAGCVQRFLKGGAERVIAHSTESTPVPQWLSSVTRWALTKTPQDFGYFRTRWSCATLAEVLWWELGIRRSTETIRRGLHRMSLVWRRPRPVVGPVDPDYDEKLSKIQLLLRDLAPDETAVFQDEVDVNLNPKIGSAWMRRGVQATVVTPGNNQKRYLAGSLVHRTGTLIISQPTRRRDTTLFLEHLDELRRRLRGYRMIHVICDNACFHKSRRVHTYLNRWGHRLQLHFLPTYAPETNPIERVWWHLHENITRNHRCQSIVALEDNVLDWLETNNNYHQEIPNLYRTAA